MNRNSDLEKIFADATPQIKDQRVDRLIGQIMLRLDAPRRQNWHERLSLFLPRPAPALRYAASALLGAVLGWVVQPGQAPDRTAVQLADLFAPATVAGALFQ
jgi:hypothetical protein